MTLLLPILSRDASASEESKTIATLTLPILSYKTEQAKIESAHSLPALTLPIFAIGEEVKPQLPSLSLPIMSRFEEEDKFSSLRRGSTASTSYGFDSDSDSDFSVLSRIPSRTGKSISWADDDKLVDIMYIPSKEEEEVVVDDEEARFNALFESMMTINVEEAPINESVPAIIEPLCLPIQQVNNNDQIDVSENRNLRRTRDDNTDLSRRTSRRGFFNSSPSSFDETNTFSQYVFHNRVSDTLQPAMINSLDTIV
jgi:hypothetical protein